MLIFYRYSNRGCKEKKNKPYCKTIKAHFFLFFYLLFYGNQERLKIINFSTLNFQVRTLFKIAAWSISMLLFTVRSMTFSRG